MTPLSSDGLRRTIREVRFRYRLRVALRGAAICLLAALVTFVVSAFGLDHFRYDPWAVASFRIFAYAAVLGLLVRFLIVPLAARVSDERVALYVEEHEPSLDAALVSAIESEPRAQQGRPDLSPELVRRLVETAVERLEKMDYGRLVERPRLNRFAGMLAGAAGVGMLLALLSPAFLRHAAPYLLMPWSVRAASPYAIDVLPGNVQIARGSDQIVTAQLKGFDSDRVELAAKGGDGEWKRQPMLLEPGSSDYRLMLLALAQPTQYFVESSGVRSGLFTIDVADKPYVKKLDLEYIFPKYTGLQPRKVEDGGDVAALKGTEVRLSITPTIRVASGRLLVEGEAPSELKLAADGSLSGSLTVVKDGFYKIELAGSDGRPQPASPDYAIEALKDQPPSVAFVKPGRDTKVTPIEEVFAEVKAEDDFGIARVELVYSVSGGEEKTLALHKGAARKFVSAGHTFFLEELGLKTGDFVSYYARVADSGAPMQTATTDIYFLEARPFRRDYRQAEQGGMPGGGGQQDGSLSQQQRQVIAATFKLVRDRARRSEKEFAEDLRTVALVQGRLREQVDGLLNRMGSRGILEPGSDFQQTADELRQAASEMKSAEAGLGGKQPKEALPPEQRALAHLQRAEGAFRDVQVAFGSQGGGGGGAQAEELADLFELELDKLRNQYETVQRGAQEQADQQVDEALQRLQELARRQEQENERLRQRASRMPNQGGGGSGSQRELADEAEELGRRLERLAREKTQPSLEETARRLRDAADAMRRSAAGARNGSTADGQAALDRLKDARRLLEGQRQARLDRDIREAQQRAEELKHAQERIASDVRDLLGSGAAGPGGEKTDRLMQRKDALASQVAELESQLDRMAQDSRREQKEASRKLQETANAIRDQKLKEKIRYSKGLLRGPSGEVAQQFESEIGKEIGNLEKRLRDAAGAVGQSEDQRRSAALDKARNLVRNMESLEERLRSAQQGSSEKGKQQGGREAQGSEQGQGEQGAGEQQGGQQAGEGQGQGQSGQQPGGGQQQGRGQRQGAGGEGSEQGDAGGMSGQRRGQLAPGGGPGFIAPEDTRQLRRELRERAQDAQDLQRELQRSGLPAQEAEAITRRLRGLDNDRSFGDPLGLAKLAADVVEDLKMLEYGLRRAAEGDKPKLYLSGSEELPPGYKALVEEYYRALARKQQR